MTLPETIQFAIQETTRFVSPVAVAAEWVLAAALVVLAALIPIKWTRPLRALLVNIANRKRTAILICGALPVVLRLSLLWWIPVPDPSIHDEFSHLLLADTMAHGRLSNPTPPLWEHFETIHVIQKPTYSSMYPPVQDSLLALGEIVFHQPWAGVVISVGLMCAATCWMMQGWLPPVWAFYGTLLLILKIGVQGFYMNSFIGGSAPAIAGALLLGCVPRLKNWKGSAVPAALYGLALVLMMNTRPFEGAFLAAATLFYMGLTLWREPRRVLVPAALVFACGASLAGYYNWRVTGNPARLGYQVNRETYGWPENLAFLPAKQPVFHNDVMRNMYFKEVNHRTIYKSPETLIDNLTTRWVENWIFLIGPLLTLPLLLLPKVWRDKETRPLIVFVAIVAFLNLFQMVLYPFHLGPVVPAIFAIVAACVRHMWRRGLRLALVLPLGLILIGTMKQDARALNLPLTYWEIAAESHRDDRADLNLWLERRPAKQLVIVTYEPWHNPDQEWVYNGADLNDSKIVWARALGAEKDSGLVKYFSHREVWRLNADRRPVRLTPYIPGK